MLKTIVKILVVNYFDFSDTPTLTDGTGVGFQTHHSDGLFHLIVFYSSQLIYDDYKLSTTYALPHLSPIHC